jgi:hypothetical protein
MSDACPMCGGKPRDEVKWVSCCDKHKAEINDADARRAGIPDLQYSAEQVKDVVGAAKMVEEIRFRLHAYPDKCINVKVTK